MKKRLIGTVVSNSMQKTITVSAPRRVRDRVTGKYVNRNFVCAAHDEAEQAGVLDVVELIETRPLSKFKRWVLVRLIRRASEK